MGVAGDGSAVGDLPVLDEAPTSPLGQKPRSSSIMITVPVKQS
ncbi:hypothetical protein Y695_04054 [Hydrogenophaga sp. T4]|nr:hypothetical protein Y695_04054 [Hydrogenophaga sp. T4]